MTPKPKNTAGRALLVLALVIAAVLGALVSVGILTRAADLGSVDRKFQAQNCEVINRQVTGARIALRNTELFAAHDASPVIRAYHRNLIPTREDSLAAAEHSQATHHCLPPKATAKAKS